MFGLKSDSGVVTMTEIHELDYVYNGSVTGGEGVPYMAEGQDVSTIVTERDGTEMVVTHDFDGHCAMSHDWSKVPEGMDPSYVCWNCDAVKFPVEAVMDDE